MTQNYVTTLFPLQAVVHHKLMMRLSDGRPSIIWAGKQSGRTTICELISNTIRERMPQVVIGVNMLSFENFAIEHDTDYIYPLELPLDNGRENDMQWNRITPYTLVFIDDIFSLPNAEQLYDRILSITPNVIASGHMEYDNNWPIGKYLTHYIGPYASWELNPLLDKDIMRVKRPANTIEQRRKFNRETQICVNKENWSYWKPTM